MSQLNFLVWWSFAIYKVRTAQIRGQTPVTADFFKTSFAFLSPLKKKNSFCYHREFYFWLLKVSEFFPCFFLQIRTLLSTIEYCAVSFELFPKFLKSSTKMKFWYKLSIIGKNYLKNFEFTVKCKNFSYITKTIPFLKKYFTFSKLLSSLKKNRKICKNFVKKYKWKDHYYKLSVFLLSFFFAALVPLEPKKASIFLLENFSLRSPYARKSNRDRFQWMLRPQFLQNCMVQILFQDFESADS